MKAKTTSVTGGCLCGLIRYEAEVFLKNGYICHCRICQKSSVTSREPNDVLWQKLKEGGLVNLSGIEDCKALGIIAQAVFDGHRYAQEFDLRPAEIAVRRERVLLTK
jgi:hypothetical protein